MLWVLAVGGVAGCAPVADPQAEAKWVKGIADDFWKAFLNDHQEQAAALLSPELTKTLTTLEYPPIGANWRPLEKAPDEPSGRWLGSSARG
jgi:hypothetical protein